MVSSLCFYIHFLCCNHNVLIFSPELPVGGRLATHLHGLHNDCLSPTLQCPWATPHCWTHRPFAIVLLLQTMPQWTSSCTYFSFHSHFLGITSQAPHYWVQSCEWFPWLWITNLRTALPTLAPPSVRMWNWSRVKCPQWRNSQTKSVGAMPRIQLGNY